jgi:hypothetical protein
MDRITKECAYIYNLSINIRFQYCFNVLVFKPWFPAPPPYSSFLGSTAQRRSWPPPQNPGDFLGGFSTIFLHVRVVSPTPNPHPDHLIPVYYKILVEYVVFENNTL